MQKNELFDNLKYVREEHDLNQKELSKIVHVTQSNYSRWESKSKLIPLNKLNELCNYFHINIDYIIGLSNNCLNMHNDNILDKKVIGKNLKMLRIKLKLTQKEMANILNTTQSVVSSYESGKTLILTAFLIEICLKYNVSVDEILGRK